MFPIPAVQSRFVADTRSAAMKNPQEVLRTKELELSRVKNEINALRIAARLLGDEKPIGDPKSNGQQVIEMP
jgi:hypothetical protein